MVDEALKGNADLLIAAARVDEARALLGEANSFFWPSVDAPGRRQPPAGLDAHRDLVPGHSRASTATTARRSTSPTSSISSAACAPARPRRAPSSRRARRRARPCASRSPRRPPSRTSRCARSTSRSSLTQQDRCPARGGARAAAQAPAGRRDLGVRAAPARGRDCGGARAAAAARARARARGSGARRAARALAAQRVPGRGARSRPRSRKRPARRRCLPACLPSCCCAVPTWWRPSARSLPPTRASRWRARIFPSISLTAFLGSESAALANLFSGGRPPPGRSPRGLTQPIFAGGRLQARRDAADARERAALAQYEQAIRSAFGEVRTALVAQARARESYEAESARAAALAETLRLARLRYQNGVASQLDVIDAERGLLRRRSRASTRCALTASQSRTCSARWAAKS